MLLVFRSDGRKLANAVNYLDLWDAGLRASCCVPVPDSMPTPVVSTMDNRAVPDMLVANNIFVVSQRFRTLIESFDVQADFVRSEIMHRGAAYTKQEYFMVNLLEAVPCLDYERSHYKQTPTGVRDIEPVVLDESKAIGHHFFLVGPISWARDKNPKGVSDIIRCASEELARAALQAGFTGVVFVRPEQRNIYPASSVSWSG